MQRISRQAELRHLFGRAGFGATPADLNDAARHPTRRAIRALFKDSEACQPLTILNADEYVDKPTLKGLFKDGSLDREMLKERIRLNTQKIRDLNILWVDRMASGQGALREKMALFWHGHFACRVNNPLFMQQYANTIRQNALGHFGDLLMAISKEPAMLQFLNNQQNRKNAPNENFAREVMELFTLGRGNYGEHDIKEAARAFTGWGYGPDGRFMFRPNQHDADSKTIFGQTGPFQGEDVVNMLINNRETARFITRKIYRFFVNDTDDTERVTMLSDRFYKNKYDIADLMETIFSADWFYDPANVGAHIKSPVELLAGMRHTLGVTFSSPQPQVFVQRTLGQILFYPPNVAGWPGGKNWIDSSSLLFRMKLPDYIFKAAEVTIRPKDEADVNTQQLARKGTNQFQTTVDWTSFETAFADTKDADLPDALAAYFLPWPLTADQRALVTSRIKPGTRSEQIKALTTTLMSLPEYQLC